MYTCNACCGERTITLLTLKLGLVVRLGAVSNALSPFNYNTSMWLLYRAEIITERFIATLSTIIVLTSQQHRADYRFRTLFYLLMTFFLLFVTPTRYVKGGDITRVNSWRRKHNSQSSGSTESLYVGYSGDLWGASSPAINQDHRYRILFSSRTQNIFTPKNDSRTTETTPIVPKDDASLKRSKRGAVHLYNMLFCATGCNPLAYKGYGCYCGFLGSGYTIDGIDRCCKMHDWCYEATDCPMFMEYFVPYYWKCYRGNRPICAVEHGEWGGSGSCSQRLCECDRALGECLRRYPCPTTKAVCMSSPWRLVQNLFMLL